MGKNSKMKMAKERSASRSFFRFQCKSFAAVAESHVGLLDS